MKKLNKTEESIFTLLSIFVLIDQEYLAIEDMGSIFKSLNLDDTQLKQELKITYETIENTLFKEILLKLCSFLDEYNTVLGVKTEEKDKEKILIIKRILEPVSDRINKWKDLKKYRNWEIAHNFRNKNRENVFLYNNGKYNIPNCLDELYLVNNFLKIMMDVIKYFYNDEIKDFLNLNIWKQNNIHTVEENLDVNFIIKSLTMEVESRLYEISPPR